MSVQQRGKYNTEFKKNAALLTEEPGRSVQGVAKKLSVHSELIEKLPFVQSENHY